MTSSPISLSRVHFPVRTLGPGQRIGIWFQGCSIRCVGCISMDTWASNSPDHTVEEVVSSAASWLSQADGITISGGEPFDQADALHELLRQVRRPGQDILVYSGYALEKLDLCRFDGLIDAIVADPFSLAHQQTLALRGSDNQRLVCLTPLGRARLGDQERRLSADERHLDLMFAENEVFMVGIPARGDLSKLSELLRAQGHQVSTTQDERASDERD